MKISAKGRYALRLMADIARYDGQGPVPIKDVSQRQGISNKYAEQIISVLVRAGLLKSTRGPQGGYRLTRLPEDYTLGDILRVMEGKLSPIACLDDDVNQCSRFDACNTIDFWQGLYDVINQYVDSVTLKDLVDKCQDIDEPADCCEYYI